MGSDLFQVTTGLLALIAGADLFVRGSSVLAGRLGIPPVIIGLTLVAIGTSSPELAVSVQAARMGHPEMALANVIGSNIFNILFILGAAALFYPLRVSLELIRKDIPVMIGVTLLFGLLLVTGSFGRFHGFLLLLFLFAYMLYLVIRVRSKPEESMDSAAQAKGLQLPFLLSFVLIPAGLALLILGSKWMISGGESLAGTFGVSERVIGLTILSMGTSLPEAASSIMASIRREPDLAIGNIVGSNIFNILGVAGGAGLAVSTPVSLLPQLLQVDYPAALLAALLILPLAVTGKILERREGVLLLLLFTAYLVLILTV